MILVDTSALIDSLTGPKRSAPRLRALIRDGERLTIPTLVLYERLRGPRDQAELDAQDALFPPTTSQPFGPAEARIAADLYQHLKRPRGREMDIAIAACALAMGASIWTLNPTDFRDIPGLALADVPPS